MQPRTNAFQQPIGPDLAGWTARPRPPLTPAAGRYCRLEPLSAERHAADLYQAFSQAPDDSDWTYMSVGPFADAAAYRKFAEGAQAGNDPLHHAIIDLKTGRAIGTLALMRIDPANGVIEVGFVSFSRQLKRTRIATEAQFLLMRRAFDELGYRRYEWKCDSLNAPSRAAASRLGFQFEGIFRQATVYKGRSRDTAWFSIIDSEWPALRAAYERWLDPDNFDAEGHQRKGLAELAAQERSARESAACA
ncbi:GNAT family N-acetyltransferase [Achromobacter deleyi]|uniref:GNAT family N-acetyltransferase n=1 Tax=Achromobacter deleyi TaxID=1353891 RepID=UPI001490F74C|nr:GNAT family protein [Achromobacter deleyi]QVQ28992.1 GNAT family N-acetyltransferase [Achromobacter deleyi]UIP19110.1 GNAT family N-acetyltransferase [Achromobacter deleyi]